LSQYFLDSSALVKRFVEEPGTTWVRGIVAPEAGHQLVVAQIAQVEIISGIMRRAREGLIEERTAHDMRLLIDRDFSRRFRIIAMTEDVIRRAEDILERHALRASDAIQLASALASSERLDGVVLEFVSSDVRLLADAAAEGLLTIDPNAQH
jgi:predicted nucleic acid-binding protein